MGKIETVMVPFFDGSMRQVDIYFPTDYKNKNYKVIYFHDGQNLYFNAKATYGTAWGIKHICDVNKYPYIIVGIYNGETNRCNEYSPFELTYPPAISARPFWNKALGDFYAEWIVHELMPFMERKYSLKQSFDNLAVCGSSLGAVMSSYMGSRYKNVFKYVGVYSLASWYNENAHLDFIRKNSFNPLQYYYCYVGTDESSVPGAKDQYLEYLSDADHYVTLLREMGIKKDHLTTICGEGGKHNEATWGLYIDGFFKMMKEN